MVINVPKVIYQGHGQRVEGTRGFMGSAIDGQSDTFCINIRGKITGTPVYDNQLGAGIRQTRPGDREWCDRYSQYLTPAFCLDLLER